MIALTRSCRPAKVLCLASAIRLDASERLTSSDTDEPASLAPSQRVCRSAPGVRLEALLPYTVVAVLSSILICQPLSPIGLVYFYRGFSRKLEPIPPLFDPRRNATARLASASAGPLPAKSPDRMQSAVHCGPCGAALAPGRGGSDARTQAPASRSLREPCVR